MTRTAPHRGLAVTAMIGAMYNTQWWPELTNAYSDATRRNDGTAMLEIADLMDSRNPDGTYADTPRTRSTRSTTSTIRPKETSMSGPHR